MGADGKTSHLDRVVGKLIQGGTARPAGAGLAGVTASRTIDLVDPWRLLTGPAGIGNPAALVDPAHHDRSDQRHEDKVHAP